MNLSSKSYIFIKIILPTLLAILLFIGVIFFALIPQFESTVLKQKKEMIKELTNTAISVLAKYDRQVKSKQLSLIQAQKLAKSDIQNLHYGKENKDYFWITDMYPKMIMHPYRSDLVGQDLSGYKDAQGKRPFILFRNKVQTKGAGYVEYSWQWKDDSSRIVPKLSFVEGFKEWNWILGTGVYLDDIQDEIKRIINDIIWISSIIILIIGSILAFVINETIKIERSRETTFQWFRKAQQRFKNLTAAEQSEFKETNRERFAYFDNSLICKQKVKDFLIPIAKCDIETRIKHALHLINQSGSEVLVITSNQHDVGIITRHDLLTRFFAKDLNQEKYVREIMTSPIISIEENALVYEALELMQTNHINKVFIKDSNELLIGLLNTNAILNATHLNLNTLASSIKNATTIEEIKQYFSLLKKNIGPYLQNGFTSEDITRIITKFTDLITTKIITLVEKELGPAPVPYAFIALGSEGREEQTLISDQDNALIYRDNTSSEIENYFHSFSAMVCRYLHEVGQEYCKGDIMAQNSKWCRPIGQWKKYFNQWSQIDDRKDMMDTCIFYDFRTIYGDFILVNELREAMHTTLRGNNIFFLNLAQVTREWNPPFDMLGHLSPQEENLPPETINIKNLIRPIVNFVRIYSLKYELNESNTAKRIQKLRQKEVFDQELYQEISFVYDYLMKIRLKAQSEQLKNRLDINNYLSLDILSKIEKDLLKACASHITNLLTKLKRDF